MKSYVLTEQCTSINNNAGPDNLNKLHNKLIKCLTANEELTGGIHEMYCKGVLYSLRASFQTSGSCTVTVSAKKRGTNLA